MSDDTPTPETNRYIGMWRPPIETLKADRDPDAPHMTCQCGVKFYVPYLTGDIEVFPARAGAQRDFLEHYLAGHFDTPVYEVKERSTLLSGANFDDITKR